MRWIESFYYAILVWFRVGSHVADLDVDVADPWFARSWIEGSADIDRQAYRKEEKEATANQRSGDRENHRESDAVGEESRSQEEGASDQDENRVSELFGQNPGSPQAVSQGGEGSTSLEPAKVCPEGSGSDDDREGCGCTQPAPDPKEEPQVEEGDEDEEEEEPTEQDALSVRP